MKTIDVFRRCNAFYDLVVVDVIRKRKLHQDAIYRRGLIQLIHNAQQFSFGGSRSDREDAAIPIATEVRREAGFTEQELSELSEISGGGPSRATIKGAAQIVRERHKAKQARRVEEAASA